MWSVKKVAKKFLILLIAAYALKLLSGRVILYWKYWGNHAEQYSSYRAQLEVCRPDEVYHKIPGVCERAKFAVETQSPWMSALADTLSETHSCVEYPCTDILHDILQKTWVGAISLSIFLLIFFFYAFTSIRNAVSLKSKYARDKKRDNDVDLMLASPAPVGLLAGSSAPVDLLEGYGNQRYASNTSPWSGQTQGYTLPKPGYSGHQHVTNRNPHPLPLLASQPTLDGSGSNNYNHWYGSERP